MLRAPSYSNIQILANVSDRQVVPVKDVDRPDLGNLYAPASAFGLIAGDGAPTDFVAAVAASYVHDSIAANADLTFTAVQAGTGGNAYTVAVVQPVTPDEVLAVSWDGTNAIISLPTDGGGSPVAATATQVAAAWNAHALVSFFISIVVEGTGAGAVDVLAAESLVGGAAEDPGSGSAWLYVDATTPALYINTGTLAEPAWTAA